MKHNFNLALFPEATIPAATNKQTLNQHLTFKANGTQGRHGWLRLTPAYSVHLVEKLVADCRQEDLVLDPFCGTGTTALVCAQAGIRCHTVDINPFLVWLAQVKCTTYSSEDVRQADNVLRQALFDCENIRQDFWTPPIKDIDKWWEPEILRLLAQIFARIRTSTLDDAAHSLCSIVFCRALIELSSVSFGHQSMSFKKKGAETQLFEVSPLERMQAVFQRISTEIFQSSCEPICEGCGQAFHGDSRHLPLALPLREYTKVITSPPYPNRMSYIRELRPYMYWLGYLDSGRQATPCRVLCRDRQLSSKHRQKAAAATL